MNLMTMVLSLGTLAMIAGCASTMNQRPQTGLLFRESSAGGAPSRYALYLPPGYDGRSAWPLIVFLNGKGECGTDGIRQTAVGLGPAVLNRPDQWPMVILFPQKPDEESAWADHDAMVMAMLDETLRTCRIDRSRVYLTGLSQGGAGTWALGSRHPEMFAAIAPVCGYGDPAAVAPGLTAMPIWAFHGENDDVVPPAKTRAIIAAIQAAGGTPRATYFPEANHNSWDAAYRTQNLGRWLLEHRR